jgi:hypothetical protein
MNLFHFYFNPPIPHSTYILYPTCILLYACITFRSCLRAILHLTSYCITNIFSPIGPTINIQNIHLYVQRNDANFCTSLTHAKITKNHTKNQYTHYQSHWIMHGGQRPLYCSYNTSFCAPWTTTYGRHGFKSYGFQWEAHWWIRYNLGTQEYA